MRHSSVWSCSVLAAGLIVLLGSAPGAVSARGPSALPILIDWQRDPTVASDLFAVREDGRRRQTGLPCGGHAWDPSRRSRDGRHYSCVFNDDSRRPDRFAVGIATVGARNPRVIYRTAREADQVFDDVHFSNDGRAVAFGVTLDASGGRWRDALAVVPTRGGRVRYLARTSPCQVPECGGIEALGWAAGDRKVLYSRRDTPGLQRAIRIVDLRRGTDRRLMTTAASVQELPDVASLSPNGRLVAVRTRPEVVRVFELARRRWLATRRHDRPPQWFPDSRRVVLHTGGGTWAYEVSTGRRRRIPASAAGAAFSPDGTRYVARSGENESERVAVYNLAGKVLKRLGEGYVSWLVWGTVG